jgi:tRNA pseudouridine38-40 synthase
VAAPLDFDLLKKCAIQFQGEHDFAAFAANRGKPVENTVRRIDAIQLRQQGALITIRYLGNGFLYKMARLMTGTLVRCAQGREAPDWISTLLAGCGTVKTSYAAPAEGLYLQRVIY